MTIVGPGGVGKTRVALVAAAQAAASYRDGPWIVELSDLRDPALLPNTVASVLGLPEQDSRSALDALLEYLRERRLLLILDTCEHVLDACAALAQAVLRGRAGRDGARHLAAAARHAGRAHLPGRAAAGA